MFGPLFFGLGATRKTRFVNTGESKLANKEGRPDKSSFDFFLKKMTGRGFSFPLSWRHKSNIHFCLRPSQTHASQQ